MAMIPPARSSQRIRYSPTSSIIAPSSRGSGKLRTEADRDGVEAGVAVGQVQGGGPADLYRQALLAALPAGQLEHRLGEVASHHASVGTDPPPELEGEVPRPAADVQRVRAGTDLGPVDRALPPLMVEARGHRGVHHVVDAGDPIEHSPNLARELVGVASRHATARLGVGRDTHAGEVRPAGAV